MYVFRGVLRFAFFLTELCALAATGYWGFQAGHSVLIRYLLGVGSPVTIAVIWGMFVAPKARIPVSVYIRATMQLVVFCGSGLFLYRAGQHQLALVYIAFALVVLGLTHLLKNELRFDA
ncbi:YrdB family protein [Alicyclobacillus sp. SO9]|uniref:YrdB family protein n=1 Tax=Alicyclobacillus sp. SO9 TaxID=2665646 RepID=UPI0018E70F1C|nr:YrdB family protein [Alicyclobacillus sp. SO9]QQE78341.1 YrdB family protein [Alicyclobacillus sp. SO9]